MNLNTYESANIGDRKSAKRVRAVMRSLITEQPFFGNLCLKMPLVEDSKLETIGGDGQVFRYNPEWINTNKADKIKFAMARIVTGCALKHHTRRGERDKNIWNQASLEACLPILEDSGYLDDREIKYGDKSVEKIYDILFEENPPEEQGEDGKGEGEGEGQPQGGSADGQEGKGKGDGEGQPSDPNGDGVIMDNPAGTNTQEEEQKWDENVAQAEAFQSIMKPGTKPGEFKEKILGGVAQLSWREILQHLLTEKTKDDYSWHRPNRRHIHNNIYLPSLYSEGAMGSMVFAIDTSGSMSDNVLSDVWGEISEAVGTVKPSDLRVIQCDTKVNSDEVYEVYDLPEEIEAKGRGGTRFSPVFEYLSNILMESPKVLVYLTDLEVYREGFPEHDPGYPVIWAYYGDSYGNSVKRNPDLAVPFGDAIRVDGK